MKKRSAKHNSMTCGQYVREHLIWGVLALFLYRQLLFRTLPGQSFTVSKLVFWVVVLVSLLVSCLCTCRRQRNTLHMAADLILPLGIYSMLAFWRDLPVGVAIGAGISLAAVMGYFAALALVPAGGVRPGGRTVAHRLRCGAAHVPLLASLGVGALSVALLVCSVFGNSMVLNRVPPTRDTPAAVDMVAFTADWPTLTAAQKLEQLQLAANDQQAALGLDFELNVALTTLPERSLAQYNHRTHTIAISLSALEAYDGAENLDSLCHEAYHAYQHQQVDVYTRLSPNLQQAENMQTSAAYAREFCHYKVYFASYDSYADQLCERNARTYALYAVAKYSGQREI